MSRVRRSAHFWARLLFTVLALSGSSSWALAPKLAVAEGASASAGSPPSPSESRTETKRARVPKSLRTLPVMRSDGRASVSQHRPHAKRPPRLYIRHRALLR